MFSGNRHNFVFDAQVTDKSDGCSFVSKTSVTQDMI